MKKTKIFVTTMMISIILAVPAFAGEWKANANGWWYENDDGSYPVAQWKEVNGKYYYFGTDGYMLASTITPDGYQVGADGAWIPDMEAKIQDNQYLDAYASFLRSYQIPKDTKPMFHLLYIDEDMIPELAVCDTNTYHGASVDLYCYNQGAVQKISSFGEYGSISYIKGKNLFCDGYTGAGGSHTYFYSIQNGIRVPLIQFETDDFNGTKYYINSAQVTEDIYKNQIQTWNSIYDPDCSFAGYDKGYSLNETNINNMLENIQNVMPK